MSLREKREVLLILESLQKKISNNEYEKIRDKAFEIASVGEEARFVRRFKYAFHLLTECM